MLQSSDQPPTSPYEQTRAAAQWFCGRGGIGGERNLLAPYTTFFAPCDLVFNSCLRFRPGIWRTARTAAVNHEKVEERATLSRGNCVYKGKEGGVWRREQREAKAPLSPQESGSGEGWRAWLDRERLRAGPGSCHSARARLPPSVIVQVAAQHHRRWSLKIQLPSPA